MTKFGCRVVNKPSQREMDTIQRYVIPWLEGYHKRMVFGLEQLDKDLKALQAYCATHDGDTVMNAAATFMGK